MLQKHCVQWVWINEEQWNNCKCIQGCWFDLITGISNHHKAEERWSNKVKEPLAKNGLICDAPVRGPHKFSYYSVTVYSKNTSIKQNGGVFIKSWRNLLFGSVTVGMKTSSGWVDPVVGGVNSNYSTNSTNLQSIQEISQILWLKILMNLLTLFSKHESSHWATWLECLWLWKIPTDTSSFSHDHWNSRLYLKSFGSQVLWCWFTWYSEIWLDSLNWNLQACIVMPASAQ